MEYVEQFTKSQIITYNKERKTCCKSEGVYSRKDCENDAETAVLYGVSDAVCV